MTKRKILFIGSKIHIIKTCQIIIINGYFLKSRLTAALRPKEHDCIDRALTGRQTAKHRNNGQQILIASGGIESDTVYRQRQNEKKNGSCDRHLFLIGNIAITALLYFLFH